MCVAPASWPASTLPCVCVPSRGGGGAIEPARAFPGRPHWAAWRCAAGGAAPGGGGVLHVPAVPRGPQPRPRLTRPSVCCADTGCAWRDRPNQTTAATQSQPTRWTRAPTAAVRSSMALPVRTFHCGLAHTYATSEGGRRPSHCSSQTQPTLPLCRPWGLH